MTHPLEYLIITKQLKFYENFIRFSLLLITISLYGRRIRVVKYTGGYNKLKDIILNDYF